MFGKKRRKHEKSILDNPEEFFNSMSREEFKVFLEEFGFEYIDLEDINITKGCCDMCISKHKIKSSKYRLNIGHKEIGFCKDCLKDFQDIVNREIPILLKRSEER